MTKQTNKKIPLGYKQTEVGIIPADWFVDRIDNNVVIKTGSKNTQDNIPDGKYPFFVRSQTIERINTCSFDGEAVLTAGDGVGTGKVFHYINGKFDVHQRVYRMTNFSKDLDGKYFFFQFSTRFYDRIMSMTAKSSVDSVRREMIAGMLIPMPPKKEQTAIANVLSDADELIENLEKLIDKKKKIKQGAMQELLTGKRRLPGFSREWEVKKLGETSEMNSGGTPSSKVKSYYGGHVLWASIADMTSVGKYISDTEKKLTNSGLTNSSAKIFSENTILYAMYASIGECCIALKPIATSQAILGIRCSKQLNNVFLYYYLTSIKDNVKLLGQQGTQSNLNKGMVENFKLKLPKFQEQTAIATVLSDMDTEIEALEQKLAKYKQIKTGMMQVLLTGKIRLVN